LAAYWPAVDADVEVSRLTLMELLKNAAQLLVANVRLRDLKWLGSGQPVLSQKRDVMAEACRVNSDTDYTTRWGAWDHGHDILLVQGSGKVVVSFLLNSSTAAIHVISGRAA
jgi:hypothetical protein